MKRLECFDGLRGLLAVYVLLGHMAPFAVLPAWVQIALSHGGAAVDVFFVLSGLVITQSLLRVNGQARPFLTARATRIFPVFLLVFAFAIVLEPWSCGFERMPWIGSEDPARTICVMAWPHAWLPEVLAHLTMTHGMFPNGVLKDVWVSFLGSSWSLSTEWQFYLLVLLAVGLGPGRRHPAVQKNIVPYGWPEPICGQSFGRTRGPAMRRFGERAKPQSPIQLQTFCWVLLAVAACGAAWRLAMPEPLQFSRAFLPNKGHFFALGVASLPVVRRESGATCRYGIVLIANLAVCATDLTIGKLLPPLAWTLCLAVQMLPDRGVLRAAGWVLRSAWAQYLGAISYCLYLVNEPIHKLIAGVLSQVADSDAMVFTFFWIPLAIGLPMLASIWLHTHVEVPAQRWGRSAAVGLAAS